MIIATNEYNKVQTENIITTHYNERKVIFLLATILCIIYRNQYLRNKHAHLQIILV